MGNKAVLGLVVLAAIAGVFFLLGGTDLLRGAGEGGGTDGQGEDAALRGADGTDGGTAQGAEAAGRGPVLFGRARAERKGVGGLEGRVMDFEKGEPVAEARVTLAGSGYADETVTLQARVDASGYFTFPTVAAGDGYVLKVSDDQGRARTLPGTSVDHGGLTDVGTVWLGRKGTLLGKVVDAADKPIAEADVQVHAGGASALEMMTNVSKLLEELDKDAEPLARATTDAKGAFSIPGVAPGPVTLVVRAPGYRQLTQAIVMAEEGAAGGAVTLRLLDGDPITGIVVDQTGRGIAGARVACLEQSRMESMFYGRQFSETGPDGRFVIASPPTQGEIAVIVTADGYPTLVTKAEGGGEQRFELVGGTEVLVRIVYAHDTRPVEGAQLMAMFSDEKGRMSSGMTFGSGTTDARGEVRFVARQGQMAMLFMNHPDHGSAVYAPQLMAGMVGMAGAKPMLQGPKEAKIGSARVTFQLKLGVGITIRGRITDEEGNAIPGARVAALGAMGMGLPTRSDAEGRYELKNQGPPVRVVLASKPGYVQKQDPSSGGFSMAGITMEDKEQDITLQRAASVAGRVVTQAGVPVAGVRVKAGAKGSMSMLTALSGGASETITNAQGRYVLDGVHPGKQVFVMARHAGYLDAQTGTFAVAEAGATQAPDLVLREGVVLQVKVERADGRAASGALVEVDLDEEDSVDWEPFGGFGNFAEQRTRGDGSASIRDVPKGQATITASLDGHAPGRVTATIPERTGADRTVTVTVTLRQGFDVEGRVVDEDDRPIPGADVMLQGEDLTEVSPPAGSERDFADWVPSKHETSDAKGRFTLKGVPGLALELRVSAEGYRDGSVSFTPGRGELVVRLAKQDPDVKRRIEAIDTELQGLYGQLGTAKDDASREALMERLRALQRERAKLTGE